MDAKSKCRLSYFWEKLQHTDFNSLSEMCLSLHGVEEAQGGGGGILFCFQAYKQDNDIREGKGRHCC